ncbi:hypothetical protein [Streptomyces lanatus]|uniref:Integral membrane protein n=1 Tax=Streptomyces lanatus TaxID=66900 RepID=A0ABV1XUD2_9ACTN|nr:hypothetical protein [Streptomyces lanatus]GHH11735.1 hypothetical protein GCM10018780_49680 [Streptomyces lanatus]
MTYRRAAIPALVGGLLLTALLWWAGASAHALGLPGASNVFGVQSAVELRGWLLPWSYDRPYSLGGGASGAGNYAELYRTAMQIRFAALFAFFVPGALLLLRRLPPVEGRMPVTLLAVWAWGVVAGTLAVAVSAPWSIAAQGNGSYRFLPQLASVVASGRPVLVATTLLAATVTVLVARVTAKGADSPPRQAVPQQAARLAATVGTVVVAVSLVVLSYQSVAAALQTVPGGGGRFGEPGDLLRQWLLLGAWTSPTDGALGDWLLYRCADVLLLAVVWLALRRLPALLTRATVPAMAVGAVCATVLGLLAAQLLRLAIDDTAMAYGALHLFAGLGGNVPAALTFGLVAGAAATVTLRLAAGRAEEAATPA